MKILLLLSLLFSQSATDRNIYVVIDNSRESMILKGDLTRDWTSGQMLNSTCYALDNKRIELSNKLVLIHYLDDKMCRKYSIPDFKSYPVYRVGAYREFKSFPRETFYTTSFPLLTTIALQNNENVDDADYRDIANNIMTRSKSNYLSKLASWAYENKIENVGEIFTEYYNEVDDDYDPDVVVIDKFVATYRDRPGFPLYEIPTLPTCPYKKFPWDIKETIITIHTRF